MGALVIFGIIAAIAVLYVLVGFTIVQQSETRVVERLGKYHRTLQSGINFILPIIDKARPVYSRYERNSIDGTIVVTKLSDKIDLREQVYDFPKQSVITKDNVTTTINALLYFQIVEPVKAVYEIDNLPNAIEKLTQTTLRNVIGELELDETLTSRDTINSKLRAVLGNPGMSDTELCFRALYAAMLYRIKGEGESVVADTLEVISPFIATLTDYFHKVEKGEIDLFKE